MKLIFLGKPGAGKGTQAEILSKKLKIPSITLGSILRNLEKRPTTLGRLIKKYIDKGILIPDNIALSIIIKNIEKKKSYILDGFPRDVYQAKILDGFVKVDKVIYIDVNDRLVVKRLSSRRECVCGETYNMLTNPPKNDLRCDKCGRKVYVRPDDKPTVIRKRLKVFKELTKPVIEYYSKRKNMLVKINGNGTIEETFKQVIKKLK